jgi:hypothetical protein
MQQRRRQQNAGGRVIVMQQNNFTGGHGQAAQAIGKYANGGQVLNRT